jgi:hypothetical protein
MEGTDTQARAGRPEVGTLTEAAREQFEQALAWCQQESGDFARFEDALSARMMGVACSLAKVFLLTRHLRMSLEPYLASGEFRAGADYAPRQLQMRFGEVTYGRHYLVRKKGGAGFHPLDAELGLTRDGFSPWLMQWVSRLATRLSYAAAKVVCQTAWGWSPSTEVIEHWVLGLGRWAGDYLRRMPLREEDGEVLVIEVDGKCTPTATEGELRKRRGRRHRHGRGCICGCQRHRGRLKRRRRGTRKRRKKGDKSKNGREVMVVVMYSLRRGPDGRLHGPINKKVWASYAGRKASALWARAEATRRGFGPDTTQTVQILMDGAKGLRQNFAALFPQAIVTLDVCHVEEKLWDAGHLFHAEGSDELRAWVEPRRELLYRGQVQELVQDLREEKDKIARHGPGTKGRRRKLEALLNYLESRLEMMRYGEWLEQDLVIATGQVEGAVRHVVGQRMDCAGMRWLPEKGEALLRLRCIEINGDWEDFFAWSHEGIVAGLRSGQKVQIRSETPLTLALAA